ncbi:MAG TPA: DUF4382 domain-containing protein [Gammaproteobacteria bacterium]|nr:DUF4382 domain-containing protein [Gammaproteobacteria bacterium]
MRTHDLKILLLLFFGLALATFGGCNNSSGTTSGGAGRLNLAITDTPVDGATSVVVSFTGVEIQPAGENTDDQEESGDMDSQSADSGDSGDMNSMGMGGGTTASMDSDAMDDENSSGEGQRLEFAFAMPRQIDLLQQQGGNSASLLSGVSLPAGEYAWIRLKVDASQSSITLADGSVHPLVIPSGDESGLKLVHGFTVAAGGMLNFTIDFDLRQSITLANGVYILKPVLRITNNESVGEIQGSVANTFMIGATAVTDPACSPAAYVYGGSNAAPVDINATSAVQPVATASLKLDDETGIYRYIAAFLAPGDYTVALVCAAGDDPQNVDTLTFSVTKNASVTAGTAAEVDFP